MIQQAILKNTKSTSLFGHDLIWWVFDFSLKNTPSHLKMQF